MTPVTSIGADPAITANGVDPNLFDGGPPRRLERSLGLVKSTNLLITRRVLVFSLAAWLPLAVIATVQALVGHHDVMAFFSDVSVHARYLVALPAFVIAERDCLPGLGRIIRHMQEIDLIRVEDMPRFQDAINSTKRLLQSASLELLVVIAAYAVIASIMLYNPGNTYRLWQVSNSPDHHPAYSVAGWWHILVSLPLLLVIILGWILRIVVWARLNWIISRLNLRLIPGHPDHCGGINFLSASLRGFRMVAFGFGAMVGGVAANRVIHFHEGVDIFKGIAIGLTIAVLILFVGPLLVYIPVLRRARQQGIYEYGELAGWLGKQFEQKWLKRPIDESALEVPDFSSTTDLYGVVTNVYMIREVPFSLRRLALLVAAALLPLIPAVLLVMPLKEVFQDLVKLLL